MFYGVFYTQCKGGGELSPRKPEKIQDPWPLLKFCIELIQIKAMTFFDFMMSFLKGLQRLKGMICTLRKKRDWLWPLTRWSQKIEVSLALAGGHRSICSNWIQPQSLRKWWIYPQSKIRTWGVRKMRVNFIRLSKRQSPVSYYICLVAATFVCVCQMTWAWMSFFIHILFEGKSCCVLPFCHSCVWFIL